MKAVLAVFLKAPRPGAVKTRLIPSVGPAAAELYRALAEEVVARTRPGTGEYLEDHDLVLGPAQDGGYYLVGLARPRPELFQGVAWSTPSVLAATMERAAALGLTVRVLDERRDIDTLDDVRAEWARLRRLLGSGPLAESLERALATADAPPSA